MNESPLSPQFIVNEKDIALNLPESTQYTSTENTSTVAETTSNEHNLNISTGTAPALNSSSPTPVAPLPKTFDSNTSANYSYNEYRIIGCRETAFDFTQIK